MDELIEQKETKPSHDSNVKTEDANENDKDKSQIDTDNTETQSNSIDNSLSTNERKSQQNTANDGKDINDSTGELQTEQPVNIAEEATTEKVSQNEQIDEKSSSEEDAIPDVVDVFGTGEVMKKVISLPTGSVQCIFCHYELKSHETFLDRS